MVFTLRKPTTKELEDIDREWTNLTSDTEWNPKLLSDDDEGLTSFDPIVATVQNNSATVVDDTNNVDPSPADTFHDCESLPDPTCINSGGGS